MDQQDLERAVEEAAAARFSATDERRIVTVTVDGTGAVVGVEILVEEPRRLRAQTFEGSVVEAVTRARQTAAAEERSALSALRDHGIDVDALRRALP